MISSDWFIASDNDILLEGIKYHATGAFINSATITGQMYDDAEAALGSPITFTYQSGTDGNYLGVKPASMSLIAQRIYTMLITILPTAGGQHTQRIVRPAIYDDR